MNSTRLIRTAHFQCLHRYEKPDWSAEKNQEIFGACYTPSGHGHSYKMEVCVTGPIATDTGMVINLKDLDKSIKNVIEAVDRKHLNFEVEEFKNTVPTTENLARFLFQKMKAELTATQVKLVRLRLFENEDLWVDESESS